MDGVNSMTGNAPDLPAFAAVCREHDALLYVDDAHGFGVIGERGDGRATPYGSRGNAIVRHFGETYDNIVLVGGFSKAYSSLLAFIACPTELKNLLKVAAPPYLYSGPSPVASLATVLAGWTSTSSAATRCAPTSTGRRAGARRRSTRLGVDTPTAPACRSSRCRSPTTSRSTRSGRFLFDRGIYVTLAAYPLVPRTRSASGSR